MATNKLIKYELGGGAGVAIGGDTSKIVVGDNFPTTTSTGMWAVTTDQSGNTYVADVATSSIYKITEGGKISLFAGGIQGYANGAFGTARFDNPTDICADKSGNLYVADTANNRIRKIDQRGYVSTLAGGFNAPTGVAVAPNGDVIVADTGNHQIRRVIGNGNHYIIAGSTEGDENNVVGTDAMFSYPTSVAVDASGNIYVADSRNYKVKKIDTRGYVSTVAGSTRGNDNSSDPHSAKFYLPTVVRVNKSGDIFVLDKVTGTKRIKTINNKTGVSTVAYVSTSVKGFTVSPANKLFVVATAGTAGGGTEPRESSSSQSESSSSLNSSSSSLSSVNSSLSSESSSRGSSQSSLSSLSSSSLSSVSSSSSSLSVVGESSSSSQS